MDDVLIGDFAQAGQQSGLASERRNSGNILEVLATKHRAVHLRSVMSYLCYSAFILPHSYFEPYRFNGKGIKRPSYGNNGMEQNIERHGMN